MSDVTAILTQSVKLKRNTSFILDEVAVSASLSPDRQPPESVRFEIEIVGNTVSTGLISIAGSTNEQISFDSNTTNLSSKEFTSVSGITISGISDGFVNIRGVTKTGQYVNQKVTVDADMSVRFYTQKGRIRADKQGQDRVAQYKVMAEPTAVLKDNDILEINSGIVGMTQCQLNFVRYIYDFDGATHHVEAEVFDL